MRIHVVNIMAFQLFWFACVLGGAWNNGWYAPAALAFVVAIHLGLVREKQRELELLVCCGAFGTFADSLMMHGGFIAFPVGSWVPWLCPFWMTALWIGFATLLNVSLAWLQGRMALAALLGLIAGPLSYYGGSRLGAITLHSNVQSSLVAIGIEWAVAMPILLLMARVVGRRGVSHARIVEAPAP